MGVLEAHQASDSVNAVKLACRKVAVFQGQSMTTECCKVARALCRGSALTKAARPAVRRRSRRSACLGNRVYDQQRVARRRVDRTLRLPHQRGLASKGHSRNSQVLCVASLPEVPGFIAGVCFDQQCQQAADRAFLIVTSVPLLGLLCAVILKYKPPSADALNREEVQRRCTSKHFGRF